MKYTVSGNMEKFDYHQQLGEFFCYCTYVANQQKYGLLRSEIESVGSRDIAIFLTSYFGNALKAQDPQKVLNIWLICTDETVLLRRLKHRATEGQPEIANRYREAINEQNFILSRQNQFITERKIDHVIDTAYKDVRQVAHQGNRILLSTSHMQAKCFVTVAIWRGPIVLGRHTRAM